MIELNYYFKLISKDNFKAFNRQGKFFLSAKFKAWENQVIWETKSQYKGNPLEGDLYLQVIAKFKNKRHCDTVNLFKGLCDALQGLVYKNDKQIKKAEVETIEKEKIDSFTVRIIKLIDE